MAKQLTPCGAVERSIITRFRKGIWNKFLQAVKQYKLIEEGDKIAVCVSGGKDSMLLAKCVQELKRHSEIQFDAEYIVMNPGYNAENLQLIQSNLALLEIDAKIFASDIFDVNDLIGGEHPCYLCARMRRGFLYARAKELGCNKMALGHLHFKGVGPGLKTDGKLALVPLSLSHCQPHHLLEMTIYVITCVKLSKL